MAYCVPKQDGNFTTTSTWGLIESTSLATAENSTTNTTTSFVRSASFTPGAVTINKIGVRINALQAAPNGTFTVELWNNTDSVQVVQVVVNASDIFPSSVGFGSGINQWIFVSFADTTLIAAKAYKIGVKSSVSSHIAVYRATATAGDWCRILVTTSAAAAAPATGDTVLITGGWTAQATKTTRTVTMDNTDTSLALAGLEMQGGGVLTYGTTASTAYALKVSNHVLVGNGGILKIGESGAGMPSTSSGILTINCGSDGQYGLYVVEGGDIHTLGASATHQALLTANIAAAGTVLTVTDTTGIVTGNEIGLGSTSRTATQMELATVSTNDSATQLTLNAGVTNAHDGTGNLQGESMLLTRNVKIFGASVSLRSFIRPLGNPSWNMENTEVKWFGTDLKSTFETGLAMGSTITRICTNCTFRDGHTFLYHVTTPQTNWGNFGFYNCNIWNYSAQTLRPVIYIYPTTETSVAFDGCWIAGFGGITTSAENQGGIYIKDNDITFKNCRISSMTQAAAAIRIDENKQIGTDIKDNIIHSNANVGLGIQVVNSSFTRPLLCGDINGFDSIRNTSNGIYFYDQNSTYANCRGQIILKNCDLIGNGTANLTITHTTSAGMLYFPPILEGCNLQSESSYTTTSGIVMNGDPRNHKLILINTNIGTVLQHTQDILLSTNHFEHDILVVGGDLGTSSSAWVTNFASRAGNAQVRFQKKAGSSTDHRSYYAFGTILSETSVRNTASGYSWKMTPSNNSNSAKRLILPGPLVWDTFKTYTAGNVDVTITGYVRKDSSYAGSAPRLLVKSNCLTGITADVTDSLTVAADTWEQLSVTVHPTEAGFVEFYFDCDGTAGSIYVDDIDVT